MKSLPLLLVAALAFAPCSSTAPAQNAAGPGEPRRDAAYHVGYLFGAFTVRVMYESVKRYAASHPVGVYLTFLGGGLLATIGFRAQSTQTHSLPEGHVPDAGHPP